MDRDRIATILLIAMTATGCTRASCLTAQLGDVPLKSYKLLYYADRTDDAALIDPSCPEVMIAIEPEKNVDFQPLQKAIFDTLDDLEAKGKLPQGRVAVLANVDGTYIGEPNRRRIVIRAIKFDQVEIVTVARPR